MNISFSIKINLVNPRKKKTIDYQSRAPPYYEIVISIKMIKTWCLGGRHYSNNIINITQYDKRNPETKKLVIFIKGTCSICGRNKSQNLTK